MAHEKDAIYLERNQLVAYLCGLARRLGWPVGTKRTEIEGWEPEWQGCVYIDLPEGQVSWHYHDREAELFASLPVYEGSWDGHSTIEKYGRLAQQTTDIDMAIDRDEVMGRIRALAPEEKLILQQAMTGPLAGVLTKLFPELTSVIQRYTQSAAGGAFGGAPPPALGGYDGSV